MIVVPVKEGENIESCLLYTSPELTFPLLHVPPAA